MINHVKIHKLSKAIEIIESSYKYFDKNDYSVDSLKLTVDSIRDKIKKQNKYNDLLDIKWEERRSFRVFCVKCIKDHTGFNTDKVNDITKKIRWSKELVSCYVSALRDAPHFMFKEIKHSLKIQMIEEYEKQRVN